VAKGACVSGIGADAFRIKGCWYSCECQILLFPLKKPFWNTRGSCLGSVGISLAHLLIGLDSTMTKRPLVEKIEQDDRTVWEAYPAWAQFSWLYLLSALTALRGVLMFRFGIHGWQTWFVGAALLVACAAILRRWVRYELTRDELTVRNGYTGREIQSLALHDVSTITVQQGIVAEFFGIGTLVIHSRTTDRLLFLRGVLDPETMKHRIEASAWRSRTTAANSHPAPT